MQTCNFSPYPAAHQLVGDINPVSRKSSPTAESLASYPSLIETAKAKLEVHLEVINSKLEAMLGRNIPKSNIDTSELRTI